MPLWSVAQTVVAVSDNTKGIVVAVGETTVSVAWDELGGSAITYPKDALAIRKPFPWE
jgi:hypothetical protein